MLTDSTCKNAKCPEGKAKFRLADSGGLYLEVSPNGSKRWFWKYRFDGKEKRLALGHYMEAGSRKIQVALKDARQLRDDARKLHRAGVDPSKRRQLDKLERKTVHGDSFETVAREFHGINIASLSPKYAASWLDRLEKDLFPWIGALPLPQITLKTAVTHPTKPPEDRWVGGFAR